MTNVWHVAARIDPDDVLDLAISAHTVLAGLSFDSQWVILRDAQHYYALTRKELADLIGAHRLLRARPGNKLGAARLMMADVLSAAGFSRALVVDRVVQARELAGLSRRIKVGSQLRIIAHVAGAPLAIWVHGESSDVGRASAGAKRVFRPVIIPVRTTADNTRVFERSSSGTGQPDPVVRPVRVRQHPGASTSAPAPPRSPVLPPQRAVGFDHVGDAARGESPAAGDDAELLELVEMESGRDLLPDYPAPDTGETATAGEDAHPIGEAAPDGGGASPGDATGDGPAAPVSAAPDEVEATRWVAAEIEDHAATEPLVVAEPYTLAISINAALLQSAQTIGRVHASPLTRDAGKALLLTVSLSSNDFTIADPERHLKVGKDGLSAGKARFDLVPIRAGLGRMTAILHRDNNFIQQLDISVQVGPGVTEPASVVSTGRAIASSRNLSRRDFGMSIRPSPTGGFDCTVWAVTSGEVKLPIRADELDAEIDAARAALLRVVHAKKKDGTRPFQDGIVIADGAVRDKALTAVALAGYTLFQKLFFHPAADRQCQALGEWLIKQLDRDQDDFKLQIVARDFPVPWAMLYLVPEWTDDAIDFERFLGMKLVLEQIPLCNDNFDRDPRIPGDPGGLSVSLNLNTDIGMGGVIAAQEAYWTQTVAAYPGIRLQKRTLAAEVLDAFNDSSTDDQIVYFFCHAKSIGLKEGGPGNSDLTLSDHGSVNLADLVVRAPARRKLGGAPLVFINACESAKLSPLFYNGFVPYFMSKGACGVIGTECEVPGRFAEAWAREFFNAFLTGKPIGEIVRSLRRDFYQSHGNLLGLLYGLYCNADTRIDPLPPRQKG